jgi:hypothetical protein
MSGGPEGGPAVITGIARDGVGKVDVIVDGVAQPTNLTNNAFSGELAIDDLSKVSSLRVTMKDSSVVNIDIGPLG